jgi:hypothetical protein
MDLTKSTSLTIFCSNEQRRSLNTRPTAENDLQLQLKLQVSKEDDELATTTMEIQFDFVSKMAMDFIAYVFDVHFQISI